VRGWRTSSAPWLCWPASKRAPPSACLRCTRSALNRETGHAYGVHIGGDGQEYLSGAHSLSQDLVCEGRAYGVSVRR
jgi:hypothetical protein